MIYEPLVFASFAVVIGLPALPAFFEMRLRRDAAALPLDPEYAMDPRYLGKSFRRKVAPVLAHSDAGDEIVFLERANERARIVAACEVPDGGSAPYAILARGPVTTGMNARLSDVYSTGMIQAGSGSSVRTLVADGDVVVGESVTVARWIDTERTLSIGSGCRITHSASAAGSCTLGERVWFRRLFGDPVAVGGQCEVAPAHRQHFAVIDSDSISSADIEIPANTLHTGSIKSGGDVTVGAGARVRGSIVARGHVRLERSSAIGGHVFSERSVIFEEDAVVGAPGAAKTVYASGDIRLSRGATVHGWIICEGQGETQ